MNRCIDCNLVTSRRLTQNLSYCSKSQPNAVWRSYPPLLTLPASPGGFRILSKSFSSSDERSASDGDPEWSNIPVWELARLTSRKCVEWLYGATESRRFCRRIWAPKSRRGVIWGGAGSTLNVNSMRVVIRGKWHLTGKDEDILRGHIAPTIFFIFFLL